MRPLHARPQGARRVAHVGTFDEHALNEHPVLRGGEVGRAGGGRRGSAPTLKQQRATLQVGSSLSF